MDQGVEPDLIADIQGLLEDLIKAGLRQRLINLIKVIYYFCSFVDTSSCYLFCPHRENDCLLFSPVFFFLNRLVNVFWYS